MVGAIIWANDQLSSLRGRTTLRLGVMVVFVNQLLLMMAGDVEPNPGPGEGKGIGGMYMYEIMLHVPVLCHILCY